MMLWSPSKDVIAAASLSDAQLDSIRTLERETGVKISDLKRREQRAKLRFVRSLGVDPIDPSRVDETRARAREAATAVLEAELERVLALRQIVSPDQWYELVMADPKSVRIGGFTPLLLRLVDGEGTELDAPEEDESRARGTDPS
jgi:hypothetical protein